MLPIARDPRLPSSTCGGAAPPVHPLTHTPPADPGCGPCNASSRASWQAAWGAMGGGLSAGRAGSMPHDALLHVSATHAAADGHVAGHEAAGAAHGGGEQDAQGAAAAATAAVVPPSRRGGALMTPDAELCAKSIEDRLWGTVERIVSSAHDPADGARMVLQVVKARHDAYAASAAATAAAGRASSSGGGAGNCNGADASGASDSYTTDISGHSVGKAAGVVGQQGPSARVSLKGSADGLGAATEAAAVAARPSPPPAASPMAAGFGQARQTVPGAHGHGGQGAAQSGLAGRLGRQWSDAAAAAAEGTGSCPPEGACGKALGAAAGQGASNSYEGEGVAGVKRVEGGSDDMDTGV